MRVRSGPVSSSNPPVLDEAAADGPTGQGWTLPAARHGAASAGLPPAPARPFTPWAEGAHVERVFSLAPGETRTVAWRPDRDVLVTPYVYGVGADGGDADGLLLEQVTMGGMALLPSGALDWRFTVPTAFTAVPSVVLEAWMREADAWTGPADTTADEARRYQAGKEPRDVGILRGMAHAGRHGGPLVLATNQAIEFRLQNRGLIPAQVRVVVLWISPE